MATCDLVPYHLEPQYPGHATVASRWRRCSVETAQPSATGPRPADVVGSCDASPYQDQVCRPSVVAVGRKASLVQHLVQVKSHAIMMPLSGKRRAWRLVKLVRSFNHPRIEEYSSKS